ncbi:MAG: decarboxylating 6-phosphogluconate dehydrogenase [Chloroflexi bacterium]|nr:decarboxylating 6-phosphogluconate dehydrogenase [Chloroflexota bacterium]
MKIGLVGLGRMGAGIRERLRRAGHEVVGYDTDPEVSDAGSLGEMVAELPAPRIVWVMVPSGGPTEQSIGALSSLLAPDDIVVEGGNSHYRDSRRRADELAARGIHLVDCGTSGGIWGLSEGFCLMVGGSAEAVSRVGPLFSALAPPGGYLHVGPVGSGHYVKMIHNGIEYAMLQAYAEGFDLLDAYDEELDLGAIASLWNHGSVVRSWLLELAERALERDPGLTGIRAHVDDSGEGRWTVLEAVEREVPAAAIAHSLFARFDSRRENGFGLRLIAALRREFGGHATQPAAGDDSGGRTAGE